MRAVAILQHTENSGVNGGVGTSGSWEDRKLNTVQSDLNYIVALDPLTGIFTFSKDGSYIADFYTIFLGCNKAQSRIVDADTGTVIALGICVFSGAVDSTTANSRIYGKFTATAGQRMKIQSRVQTSYAAAYGYAAGFGTEVYINGSISVLG